MFIEVVSLVISGVPMARASDSNFAQPSEFPTLSSQILGRLKLSSLSDLESELETHDERCFRPIKENWDHVNLSIQLSH